MSSILKEQTYLLLLSLTTAYMSFIVIGHFTSRLTGASSNNVLISSPPPFWTAIVLTPLALYFRSRYYWLNKMRTHGTQPAPLYPHRDPILGTDWIVDLSKAFRSYTVLQVWHDLFWSVGNTYWAQNIGTWIVMTNEPENVKALLSSHFESWHILGLRQQAMVLALGPRAIFSVNGQAWHESRAMIRPSFVRNQIADLECTDRHVEAFLTRIPRDGSLVDLQELFYLFTMDVATDFMFGYSTDTLLNPTPEALEFTNCFDHALLSSVTRARLGWVALLWPNKKLEQSTAVCRQFIDRYVQKALAAGREKERPYVFMNEMLASGASQEYVRDQLLAMILGGRDTSASTMSSLFWELARRPEVVEKMRAEIAGLNGEKLTWENLKELKYLNMVLKEALRLWAPVATNSRTAKEDTVLPKGGGPDGQSPLFVPKGTACRWSLYSLHRRKDIFGDDAEEFKPERWEKLRTTWEYLPFGGGPRICIGQQFALTQMSYLITRLLQTVEAFEAGDEKPMQQELATAVGLELGDSSRARFLTYHCCPVEYLPRSFQDALKGNITIISNSILTFGSGTSSSTPAQSLLPFFPFLLSTPTFWHPSCYQSFLSAAPHVNEFPDQPRPTRLAMSEKHPGVGHPETSSMEPGNRTPGSMTGAEIGIVVTTVICFIFMIATLLWCRHRRVKDALRRAEEGEVEGQEKHQSQQKDDGHTQGQEDAPGSGQKQSKGRHWWGFLTKPSGESWEGVGVGQGSN
ncbi:hypothetical protein ACJZ2D_002759 [Fusarium nematophilum]